MVLRGRGALRAEDLALPEAATRCGLRLPTRSTSPARAAEARRRLALELAAADAGRVDRASSPGRPAWGSAWRGESSARWSPPGRCAGRAPAAPCGTSG